MKFAALEAFYIPQPIIDAWERTVGPELLPVQEKAVRDHQPFAGRNLVVFAPTSSAKTMIGKMAAVRVARIPAISMPNQIKSGSKSGSPSGSIYALATSA